MGRRGQVQAPGLGQSWSTTDHNGPISQTAQCHRTGGKENELHLWDLNTFEKPVFQAKNVRHDKLELRVPVWISGIAFCPENADRVSVVSKHGHVRQYDIRCGQKRP